MTRRRILDWFLGTSVGAMCAAVAYPVLRYLVPPDLPEAPTSRVVAARDGELKPNQARVSRSWTTPRTAGARAR